LSKPSISVPHIGNCKELEFDLRNRNVETTKKGRGTGGYGSDRCSTVRRHGAGSSPSQRVG
jgi:hypothetical protein